MRKQLTEGRKWGRHFAVAVVMSVLAAGCAQNHQNASNTQPAFYQNLESSTSRLDVQDAAIVISSYRQTKGFSSVRVDPELVQLAQNHASAQARASKVGHEVGGTFSQRIKNLEAVRGASVENVSAGYRSFAEAFSGWRESRRHNDNLLNPKVTRFGIAKAVNPGSKFKVFWTLIMTSEPLNK